MCDLILESNLPKLFQKKKQIVIPIKTRNDVL